MRKFFEHTGASTEGAPLRRRLAVAGVAALSLLGGACSLGTTNETKAPPQEIATGNPSVDEFKSTLEEPARDFALEIAERLMGPESVTERTVAGDLETARVTNKWQGAGIDGKFGTQDDPNIPEARFDVFRVNGVTYIIALVVGGDGPLNDKGTRFSQFEASFRVDSAVDPSKAELGGVIDLLLDREETRLVGIDARGFQPETERNCRDGLEISTSRESETTLRCPDSSGRPGVPTNGDPSSPFSKDEDTKILPARESSEEIARIQRELEKTKRDILGVWNK
jgi:hypothetical protein